MNQEQQSEVAVMELQSVGALKLEILFSSLKLYI